MSKIMVILNPAARSAKAAGLLGEIETLVRGEAVVALSSEPGDARRLAREAALSGAQVVVAAGGDGTVNDVLNGIAGTGATLGILPTGTMNVFATELGLPRNLREAWAAIRNGDSREIDLPRASGHAFVQMAGVGLDAQALQSTSWEAKRNLGPLSYVISAAQVAARKPPTLRVKAEGAEHEGSFVLIGNGRFYGGPFPVFPNARLDDGLLDVILFERVGHLDLIRYLQAALFGKHIDMPDVTYLQTRALSVASESDVPVEVDGEVVGRVPVDFECEPRGLRVIVPG